MSSHLGHSKTFTGSHVRRDSTHPFIRVMCMAMRHSAGEARLYLQSFTRFNYFHCLLPLAPTPPPQLSHASHPRMQRSEFYNLDLLASVAVAVLHVSRVSPPPLW